MNVYETRLDSFYNSSAKWSHTHRLAENLALCGFYLVRNGRASDTVRCFLCNVELSSWNANADPKTEHAKASPDCAWIALDCPDGAHALVPTPNTLPRSQAMRSARNRTFSKNSNWPPTSYVGKNQLPSASKLADAGFYYSPTQDCPVKVSCPYCLVSLTKLDRSTRLLAKHRELSPECPYFKMVPPTRTSERKAGEPSSSVISTKRPSDNDADLHSSIGIKRKSSTGSASATATASTARKSGTMISSSNISRLSLGSSSSRPGVVVNSPTASTHSKYTTRPALAQSSTLTSDQHAHAIKRKHSSISSSKSFSEKSVRSTVVHSNRALPQPSSSARSRPLATTTRTKKQRLNDITVSNTHINGSHSTNEPSEESPASRDADQFTGSSAKSRLDDSIWDIGKVYKKQEAARAHNPYTYSKKQRARNINILPAYLTMLNPTEQRSSAESTPTMTPESKSDKLQNTHDTTPRRKSTGKGASRLSSTASAGSPMSTQSQKTEKAKTSSHAPAKVILHDNDDAPMGPLNRVLPKDNVFAKPASIKRAPSRGVDQPITRHEQDHCTRESSPLQSKDTHAPPDAIPPHMTRPPPNLFRTSTPHTHAFWDDNDDELGGLANLTFSPIRPRDFSVPATLINTPRHAVEPASPPSERDRDEARLRERLRHREPPKSPTRQSSVQPRDPSPSAMTTPPLRSADLVDDQEPMPMLDKPEDPSGSTGLSPEELDMTVDQWMTSMFEREAERLRCLGDELTASLERAVGDMLQKYGDGRDQEKGNSAR